MALSNMRREPRRELTEQAVGLIILVGLVWGDYELMRLAERHDSHGHYDGGDIALAMIGIPMVVAIAGVILVGAVYGMHAIGEGICNLLADRGVELRPRMRK